MLKPWKFRSACRSSSPRRRIRPCLEVLEDRLCPAILTVTTLNDTSTAAATSGSLRQVLAQNVSDNGGDTIVFAAGLNGTMDLNKAFGALSNGGKSVTIANPNGDTIAISGQGNIRDLDLTGEASVQVSITGQSSSGAGSLTITDGKLFTSGAASGVGILNDATTVLTDVSVTDNTASSSSSGLAQGGGIYNGGTLTLNNVTVSGNTASSSDGNAQGGGIYNSGTLTLNNVTVSGNIASSTGTGPLAEGGGIFNSSTLTVSASVISGNTATNTSGGEAAGGGICNTSGATFFSLTDSTVSGNTASNSASNGEALGGGIFCSNRTFQSILTFQATNDTVWNNNVTESGGRGTAEGGGIYTTLTTTTTLINLTVGDNTATASGGTAEGGGIFLQGSQTTNLVNTIVSDPNGPSSSPDVSGTVTNAQNNDFASTAGLTITNNLGGNLLNIAPLLGSLTFNGGPTPTVAELSGSPTIDAGTSSSRLGTIPTTDQRGAPRPDVAGTNPDIGAFEFQAPPTPTPTPPPTPITVPSPLNTAVTLANTLTNRQIGFALAAQPLLSNPLDLQLAFLSFTAVNQALAAQPLNNALLFEEAVLAQALAAFINNPGGYAANSTATNQLAQLIVLDSLDLSSNPLFQTLAGLEEGALAKTLDLFLLTSSGSQTTAAEQALQGVAPLL